MEDFNSKYTGQQVEDILDQVASGGSNEVYIADFTRESLRKGVYDGTNVECDIRALVDAMNANKVILVREDKDSSYKGVYVLNGYAEDLLYFSIVDTYGSILWCEGTDYINSQFIEAHSLHERNWGSKQNTLVSGENIKTINGESILGSGDIEISSGGGSSSGGNGAYPEVDGSIYDSGYLGNYYIVDELMPNTFYVFPECDILDITELGPETAGVSNEYLFQFTSGATATSLTLPGDIKWANELTIEPNMIYQVSILKRLASVLEFSNAPVQKNNMLTLNNNVVTAQYPVASDIYVACYTEGPGEREGTILKGETSCNVELSPFGGSGNATSIYHINPKYDDLYIYVF